MFDVLSNPYRRRVLLTVRSLDPEEREGIRMDSLVSELGGDEDPDDLRTLLFHAHLPNLAEKGYVRWNPDTGVVRRGTNFDDIEPLIELLVEHERELPADFP